MRQVSGLSNEVCKNACKLASKFSNTVYVTLDSCGLNRHKLICLVAWELCLEPFQAVYWWLLPHSANSLRSISATFWVYSWSKAVKRSGYLCLSFSLTCAAKNTLF